MLFRRLLNKQYLIRNFCDKYIHYKVIRNKALMRYFRNTGKEVTFDGKGDGGTSTLAGQTYTKDHDLFHALGAAEELLSILGMAREHAKEAHHEYVDKLKRVQTIVIEISTALAKRKDDSKHQITSLHIKELEDWKCAYKRELPPPEHYILPGGGVTSATIHMARSICRKTERCMTPFVRNGTLNQEVQVYLNRLEKFLFTLSRIASKLDKEHETIYVPFNEKKIP